MSLMQEDELIRFEKMPSLNGTSQKKQSEDEDTIYIDLFDEMETKCNPKRYLQGDADPQLFESANQIYGELMKLSQQKGLRDEDLTHLRNRAIRELGVTFSTRKICDRLSQYFDPNIYIDMTPYDAERVAAAKKYHDRLEENRRDILALEQLAAEARYFINHRDSEIREQEEEEKRIEKQKEEERKKEEADWAAQRKEEDRVAAKFYVAVIVVVFIVWLTITLITN